MADPQTGELEGKIFWTGQFLSPVAAVDACGVGREVLNMGTDGKGTCGNTWEGAIPPPAQLPLVQPSVT